MSIAIFNPELSQSRFTEEDILSTFRMHTAEKKDIHKNMTSEEIADVVSDRIISVIKEQFESAKKDFEAKEAK